MIVPRLYGRCGNQAFQISAAIAHAKKSGTVWRVPNKTQDMKIWPHYFLHYLHPSRLTPYTSDITWNEDENHVYKEIPKYRSAVLNGYFQSEKYFEDAKEEIGNALGFHCTKKSYIAVHVRRGDYVTQFSDKHPPLDLEYYKLAIAQMKLNGFNKFKFYSDDLNWCHKTFEFILKDDEYFYSAIADPLSDMRDMYNASGFIIANSSFSLFPALLRLDNPVTIAPEESRWFGPGNSHLSTKNLMPERFIKL